MFTAKSRGCSRVPVCPRGGFDTDVMSCVHPCVTGSSVTALQVLCPSCPSLPPVPALAAPHLFPAPTVLPLAECRAVGIVQRVVFPDWLRSHNNKRRRFFRGFFKLNSSFLFGTEYYSVLHIFNCLLKAPVQHFYSSKKSETKGLCRVTGITYGTPSSLKE